MAFLRARTILILALAVAGLAVAGGPPAERVVPCKGYEDPAEFLAIVENLRREPTGKHLRDALALLDRKLEDWSSVSKWVVCDILEIIEERRLSDAVPQVLRLVAVPEDLEYGDRVAFCAASALATLKAEGAFEALMEMTRSRSVERIDTAAWSLGVLGDARAVARLNELAVHPEAKVRARAVSALSRFCDPSSFAVVWAATRDSDAGTRMSGAWWFAACGSLRDERLFVELLADPESLVRANALKGLIRVRSTAACSQLPQLLSSQDLTVRELARQYEDVCTSP